MTERSLDENGSWRNKPVTFRVSPEECERIDAQVAMSGLSKQDYIAKRLMGEDVVVVPNSRVQRALQSQALDIYRELRRIRNGSDISPELDARIRVFASTFEALGVDCSGVSAVEVEDGLIANMKREAGPVGKEYD